MTKPRRTRPATKAHKKRNKHIKPPINEQEAKVIKVTILGNNQMLVRNGTLEKEAVAATTLAGIQHTAIGSKAGPRTLTVSEDTILIPT